MILDLIKNIVFGYDWELKKITSEYLLRKKSSMTKVKYIRWLRVQVTICQAKINIIKDSGKSVPQELSDKYQIIETERANEEKGFERVVG